MFPYGFAAGWFTDCCSVFIISFCRLADLNETQNFSDTIQYFIPSNNFTFAQIWYQFNIQLVCLFFVSTSIYFHCLSLYNCFQSVASIVTIHLVLYNAVQLEHLHMDNLAIRIFRISLVYFYFGSVIAIVGDTQCHCNFYVGNGILPNRR